MKTIMITITENNNSFGGKHELYNFCIVNNGKCDHETLLVNMLKDMDNKGFINLNKYKDLFIFNFGSSIKNIFRNIKPVIMNITDNTEIIKKTLKHEV